MAKLTKEEKELKKQQKKALKEAKLEKRLSKPSKFNNIFTKVNLLLAGSIILAVFITAYVTVSYAKNLVVDSAYGKMLNTVTKYGSIIDKAEVDAKAKNGLKLEENAEILKDVKLEGVPSSFCYVINKSGVIAYHPDESKVNKPNKVKILTEVVAGIAKGHTPDSLTAEFKEDGVTKYCSYYITTNKSIIVMCANGDDLMGAVNELYTRALLFGILVLAVAILVSFFIVSRITKPLKKVQGMINDTAELKLSIPEEMDQICRRGDEAGQIGRSVKRMSQNLREVVGDIDTANGEIENNMHKVEESSAQIHELCMDNSATTEELSASTEQVSDMTTTIAGHMEEMRQKSSSIKEQTLENSKVSDEISQRADNLQKTTQDAIDRTKEMYSEIKERTEVAIEELKAVSKIDELTAAINDISDQTSLLSLNASIEAARAGEAGRGFAVVASEISSLANRSKDTVGGISVIINEVNAAVDNIKVTIEETMTFLEDTILKDYDGFNQIGDRYRQDAELFKTTMEDISRDMDNLNGSIEQIAGNLMDIQETVNGTSEGVTDVANKTTDVVSATSDNQELTKDTVARVDDLRRIVKRFEL